MNMKLSFSWVGLVVFALPMLINIAYVIFPPTGEVTSSGNVTHGVEIIEAVSRIVYFVLLTFWVNKNPLKPKSVWLLAAVVFLILYYIVWIRYFIGGRNVALLGRSFLFVPIPLAIFPVVYYLCAAIWMGNIPAAVAMAVFGAAHITVSVQSFCR